LRRYKAWPYLGGVRTPLIVSWPKHIDAPGVIRTQYVDVIDIAPTILDAAGAKFATKIDGVDQIPIAGSSFLKTFTSAVAPTRSVQYFEQRGNRAITQGKWRAVAMHRIDTDSSDDKWQLFDTEADFSESTDLSKKYPKKLEELKNLWWEEAKRYSDPPLLNPSKFRYEQYRFGDAFTDVGD
jgi:Arylsulfatase A and related enzymes